MKKKITKFEKMTAAQKRVAIAKDVLARIRTKKLKIRCGKYYSWTRGYDGRDFNKETLTSRDSGCICCAVGAAITSGIRLFNKISMPDEAFNFVELISDAISEWFTPEQAALIEVAFESRSMRLLVDDSPPPKKQISKADIFHKKYRSNKVNRVKAIFTNIIKNKGTFKP